MVRSFGRTTKVEGGDFPTFDDDFYLAQVANVTDGDGEFQGVKYNQYILTLDLVEELKPNGDPHQMKAWIRIPPGLEAGEGLSDKSKLYEFLSALGYDDDNLEVEPAKWQGEQLRVQIENKVIKEGERKGESRSRITGFKPLKGSGPKAAERAQERRSSPPPATPRRSTQRDEEPERPAREPARAGAGARSSQQDEWD
jgi:hypothetical protein